MFTLFSILMILFVITLVILHFAAFITSFYCFKHGVNVTSIFGFFIMVFMGPFFWFYFAFAKNYCKELYNINPIVQNNVNQIS
jgi:cation transporter-like permease